MGGGYFRVPPRWRDPESDNDRATNWADSDESGKAEWTAIEGAAAVESVAGQSARSLQIQLLGAGEMLIDDVEVFNTGGANKVRNADFEANANWVFQGNHVRSVYEDVDGGGALRIRASGRDDPHSNRVRQRMGSALSTSRGATMRARVRWLRGHPEILLRTLGNHIETFGLAQIPANLGSPGRRNSTWISNAGPTIENVRHSPVLPAADEPITVTAEVQDPETVAAVRLVYRNDSVGGETTTIAMVDDGGGTFTASIEGAASGQLIAFSVEADDAAGTPATSRFPPEDGECLARFGEAPPRASFGDYRLWFTRATRGAWVSSSRPRASNEPLSVTFVSNGERVIHDAGAMFSGSFFNSPNYDTPTGNPCDYACAFPGDDRFLGAGRIILSWPGLTGTPDRTAQHEQLKLGQLRLRQRPEHVRGQARERQVAADAVGSGHRIRFQHRRLRHHWFVPADQPLFSRPPWRSKYHRQNVPAPRVRASLLAGPGGGGNRADGGSAGQRDRG